MAEAEVNEEQSPGISDELESYVPENLPTSGVISTVQKYNALHTRFYETLNVKQTGDGTQYLVTSFCIQDVAALERFRGIIPELAGINSNPIGLFHALYVLKNSTVNRTRDQKAQVVTSMANVNVNAILRAGFAEQGDNNLEPDYLITLFNRYVNSILASITMLHQKTRLGVISYSWCKKLQTLLRKLQTKVQEMSYSLCTRSEANSVALLLVKCRAKALVALNEYALLRDPVHVANCHMYMENFVEVNRFQFAGANGLTSAVENRTLWTTFIYQVNFEATEVAELDALRNTLNDLFKEIKTFVPSDIDKANDIAMNLRPAILATCEDYDRLINSPDKTLGMATSLMKDIDGHRSSVQQLQSYGLIINAATVGSTQQNLQTMYARLSDYVHEEQQKVRLAETKTKIEMQELSKASANVKLSLRPLTGIHAWLSFYQSYQEIIPLHSSELVKAELVRESLRDKKDKKDCMNLSHEDIMSYLKLKYDDVSNIPDLILEITGLPPAGNYQQSHDNIIRFKEMCMHLEHHKAEFRLDGATRDKLLPILLPEKLLVDFLRSRTRKEAEWKQELNLDDPTDVDDALSTISICTDERLEERRRRHFITEMTDCLPILKHLMKNMSISQSSSSQGRRDKFGHKGTKHCKTQARMANPDEDSSVNSDTDDDDDNDDDDDLSDCPICYYPHLDQHGTVLKSLSRCPKFKRMDVKTKHKVIKKADYCKLCLRSNDPDSHMDGICEWAEDRNLVCYEHENPDNSHHPLLCRPPRDSGKNAGSVKSDN